MLEEGREVRVSSRWPVDDLEEVFGFDVEEEDVDSVGGLMAKHLGRVPIPGSHVEAHGLRFDAEDATGRRNKVSTVRIRLLAPTSADTGTGSTGTAGSTATTGTVPTTTTEPTGTDETMASTRD